MKRLPGIFVLVGLALLSASCGSSEPGSQTTITRIVTKPGQATTADATTDSESPGADQGEISQEPLPTASGILGPARAGSALALTDFFEPDENTWSQGVLSVADQTGLPGVKGDLYGCGESSELELRLGNHFQTLTFSTGQENSSPSSAQYLVVTVAVNGRQAAAKRVAFNAIQKFSVNVGSVNSVSISFETDESGTGCDKTQQEIYPVLFNAAVN